MSDPQTEKQVSSKEDTAIQAEIQNIIDAAEETRLQKMQQHRDRAFLNTTLTLLLICIGSGLFGWFFLVNGDIALALLFLICTVTPPVFFQSWADEPLRKYREEHKKNFMPAMAKALGGLKFHPKRGISSKVLSRTGIVPAHKDYRAEDFFMGRYKGVKLMISEARLTHPHKRGEFVFDGLFVLLELPDPIFKGHNILTADHGIARRLSKKLKPVSLPKNEHSLPFTALSSSPDDATFLSQEQLLKEVYEMHMLFAKSELSAAFFKGKYIFVMIPYEEDMFEASNIFVPVTTSDAAMRCKKEVEQILSIIDILKLYKGGIEKPAEPKSQPSE